MMHINVAPQVTSLLQRKLSGRQTMPLLISGQYGQGRSHYLTAYMRQRECRKSYQPLSQDLYLERCNCQACIKIAKQKTPDIVTLDGTEGIEEARDKIALFKDSRPSELSQKYVILKNIDYFSKAILDTALKLIEEPKQGHEVFATMQPSDIVSGAFKSRFITLNLPQWTRPQLDSLTEHFEVFKPFKSFLDKTDASTPYQLTTFPSVTEPVTSAWLDSTSIASLIESMEKTKKRIADSPAPNMSLTASLKHYIYVLRKIPSPRFQDYLNTILLQHNAVLIRNIGKINSSFQMSLDNQLFSLLSAILVLRKSLKC